MEASSGDESRQLLGGRSCAENWLPALTPSADVDLEQDGTRGDGGGGGHTGIQERV